MSKRRLIMVGMGVGLLWSILLLWGAARFVNLPVFTLMPTIMAAFLAPGAVMLLMIGRLAQRRFFDDSIIDGQAFVSDGPAEIDQRVLSNTCEQLVLALCIWPGAAIFLAGDGPGVIVVLGVNFAVMRLFFWGGYHLSPPLRAFGFAAGFYPTVLVTIWAFSKFLTFGS